jgi:succinate dehydrogenase / fumarate reductase flavoprotein subunit
MESYDTVLKDRAPVFKIVVSAAKEAMKGNAPISINVEGMTEEDREKFRLLQVSHGWMPILFEKCEREEGYNPLRDNIEWQPAYEANKLGIRSDIDCGTSLEGLFAAGMARTLGINSFTGWSIASCTWSGYTAGESAGRYAAGSNSRRIDPDALREKRAAFIKPAGKKSGHDPDDLVREIQKILFPVDVLIIMKEAKLRNALEKILKIKEEKLPNMAATDTRTLIKARETETMVLSAEMTLRASLMRKETRENIFYREDYPKTDNENWLKWIIVEKGQDGDMEFSTEDVPFDRYKFRPPSHPVLP